MRRDDSTGGLGAGHCRRGSLVGGCAVSRCVCDAIFMFFSLSTERLYLLFEWQTVPYKKKKTPG